MANATIPISMPGTSPVTGSASGPVTGSASGPVTGSASGPVSDHTTSPASSPVTGPAPTGTPTSPLDRRLRLPDGRWLGFAEWGDPAGRPILLCHGLPGSRLPGTDTPPDSAQLPGLRFIGIDRPGIGLSSYQPGRGLLDWPPDLAGLADGLGIEQFTVLGGSAGGPYALAAAHAIPERLRAVVVVNGPAPFDRPGAFRGYDPLRQIAWRWLRAVPAQAYLFAWLQARQLRESHGRLPKAMVRTMARADRAALRDPAFQAATAHALGEAFRQGPRGIGQDMVILTRPWGFRLADIRAPVHLWQGTDDRNVPLAAGEYLARSIPGCRAHFVPGAGHLLSDPDGAIRDVLLA